MAGADVASPNRKESAMIDKTNPVLVAINDARALIVTLLASDFNDMHVVSGETEIFLARPTGRANPMRARVAPVEIAPVEPAGGTPMGLETVVKAPHIATLCVAALPGSMVAAGEQIATLSVLNEEFAVLAPVAGQIIGIKAALGSLVEFDQPILLLREIA
jgi:acetyl-CoA carboxylase biotin carboxyl carrier protein